MKNDRTDINIVERSFDLSYYFPTIYYAISMHEGSKFLDAHMNCFPISDTQEEGFIERLHLIFYEGEPPSPDNLILEYYVIRYEYSLPFLLKKGEKILKTFKVKSFVGAIVLVRKEKVVFDEKNAKDGEMTAKKFMEKCKKEFGNCVFN